MRPAAAVLLLLLGACSTGAPEPPPDASSQPAPSASVPVPVPTATVRPPGQPLTGEVARFQFVRPGNDRVSVGPTVLESDELVLRAACVRAAGGMTWQVLDAGPDLPDDVVRVLAVGSVDCDGSVHRQDVRLAGQRSVSVLAVDDPSAPASPSTSAWVVLAQA